MIEAKRGWANTISTKQDWSRSPTASARVRGPAQHLQALRLRDRHAPDDRRRRSRSATRTTSGREDFQRVDLKVHPLVLELTGKTAPKTGLEGKFSIYHAAAVAFVEGAGGEKQFSDGP